MKFYIKKYLFRLKETVMQKKCFINFTYTFVSYELACGGKIF